MKKFGYVLSTLALVSFTSLVQADEIETNVSGNKQEQNVNVTVVNNEVPVSKALVSDPSRWALRVGMIKSGGTYIFEDDDGHESPEFNLDDDGFEISLVSGIDKSPGFDFRSALTFQKLDGVLKVENNGHEYDAIDTSTMLLLGDFEFAFNVNKFLTPFVGFSGGIGLTDFSSDYSEEEESYLTSQLGAFVGVSGDIFEDFGYYAKFGMAIRYIMADDGTIKESLNPMQIGVSYTF